jgi:hypothetical protein
MICQAIKTEKDCSEACVNASEKICRCSCGGLNHGAAIEMRLDAFEGKSEIETDSRGASGPAHSHYRTEHPI